MRNLAEELEIVPKRFLNKVSGVRAPEKQCEWCRKNNISFLADMAGYPKILIKELMKHLQQNQENKRAVKPFDVSVLDQFNGKKKRS